MTSADPDRRPDRARIDAVFGETEPRVTSDELAGRDGEREGLGDDWWREQRPPHHD